MESLGDILKRLTPKSTSDSMEARPIGEAPPEEPCPLCGGRGWLRKDVPPGHPDFGAPFPCGCRDAAWEQERLWQLQHVSNLGLLAHLTFHTLDLQGRASDPREGSRFQEVYQACVEYADHPEGWLVLAGPTGGGKTHLAAAIANRCLERGVPAFYISVPDLLDHLRAAFAPSSEVPYDQLFDRVRNTPVLVLDDLGAHAATPWAKEKLAQLLNHRFNLRLPTVLALADPVEALEEPLRVRLADRGLVQMVKVAPWSLHGRRRLGDIDPEMLRRMTFQSFDTRGNGADAQGQESLGHALRAAQEFAPQPKDWLVFAGPPGCGKTHLAVALANQRLRQGQSVFFALVADLLDYLRHTFRPESTVTYDRLFEEVRATPLLILDDLGAESTTSWAQEKLYQIIVHRHNARLPTVITTSRLLEELPSDGPAERERGGGRGQRMEPLPLAIASRLKDATLVTLVPIAAPDYRDSGPPRTPARGARRPFGERRTP